jgi:hypothetical protein
MRPRVGPFPALAVVVAFAAGLSAGRHSGAGPHPTFDLAAGAGVMRLDNPGGTHRRLTPYRVVADGVATDAPGEAPAGARWRLDLADGRVTVFAAEPAGVEP